MSSTADRRAGAIHRPTPGCTWGRADVQACRSPRRRTTSTRPGTADPARVPARVKRDQALSQAVYRVWNENYQVYGARKVWRQLQREGQDVARCTVERLMKRLEIQGVIRGGKALDDGV